MMIATITEVEAWTLASALVVAVCAIGAFVCGIIVLRRKQDVRVEQPLRVSHDQGSALEKDCLTRYQANEREIAELKRLRQHDDKTDSIHRKSIYDKMDALRKEMSADLNEMGKSVASLDTETKNQNQWLGRIDQKLDDLKNTR